MSQKQYIYRREPDFLKVLGSKIREIREKKNMTQEELAFAAGYDLTQVGRIERGDVNTSVASVFILSKALKVHIKDFFDIELPG